MLNIIKNLRNNATDEEGFTLIELMIVVVIIGILAAIAIPIFMNQQKAAIVAGIKSDVKNTNTNIATYLVKNPTASDLAGSIWENNSNQDTASTNMYKIVRSNPTSSISIGGDWQGYFILGRSTLIGTNVTISGNTTNGYYFNSPNGFGVLYDSKSGKLTVTGD